MNLNLPAKRYIHQAVEELKTAAKPYSLVSKKTGMNLTEYKGDTLNLIPFEDYSMGLDGITVDEVIVQSTKSPEIKKTITTFRDIRKHIVERIIEQTTPDSKLRNRTYKRDFCPEYKKNKTFNKRVVQEYSLPKEKIQDYKQRLNIAEPSRLKDIYWNHDYTITNILEVNQKKLQKLLTTIKTVFNIEKNTHSHSVKESAPLKAVDEKWKIAKKTKTKFFEMVTSQKDDGEITIKNITKSPEVSNAILNDEYLPFRLYEATDLKEPITKYFLWKNNLENLGIEVIPNINLEGISRARFNNLYGNISFSNNKHLREFAKKTDFVNDAAHEVEHARQHSLIGRLMGEQTLNGSYYNRCFEKKGPIQDMNSFFEAEAYFDDMSLIRHFDFNNPEVFKKYSDIYFKSLLEKDARNIGESVKEAYIAQGQEFAREFSHIPHKWMP